MAAGQQKTVSIGMVGCGLIGSELQSQIESQRAALAAEGVAIDVVAVCNSKKMALDSADITSSSAQALDYDALARHMTSRPNPCIVRI